MEIPRMFIRINILGISILQFLCAFVSLWLIPYFLVLESPRNMRIAILGGTFDPIHNGHLAAAQSVAETFHVDEVHFVPAFSPPHKQSRGITSPFHRFAMVALATVSFDRFRASAMEVDALEKRYTVETLEAMKQLHPGAE